VPLVSRSQYLLVRICRCRYIARVASTQSSAIRATPSSQANSSLSLMRRRERPMTSDATRSAVSPVDVIERTDLNPDAAMQSAVEDMPPPPLQGKRQAVNGSIIAGMGLIALAALW